MKTPDPPTNFIQIFPALRESGVQIILDLDTDNVWWYWPTGVWQLAMLPKRTGVEDTDEAPGPAA